LAFVKSFLSALHQLLLANSSTHEASSIVGLINASSA
jgi:hypothetical protein